MKIGVYSETLFILKVLLQIIGIYKLGQSGYSTKRLIFLVLIVLGLNLSINLTKLKTLDLSLVDNCQDDAIKQAWMFTLH